ncbi:hypothetical protein [Microbacterium sp. HMH0099]|uniref:hypothetical protein n=1 Tax=Microbacterium sp. HMH0099 TaxID=3414026 RepID=UPI003BF8706B
MGHEGPKQRRKALNEARKAMEAELAREQGDYRPPDRDDCSSKEWYLSIDDSANLRISIWTWRFEGRLVDFLMLVETGDWAVADAWQEVARIDCSGGRCHLHPPNDMDEHELILRLDSIDDVEKAFGHANTIAVTVAIMIRDGRS